MGRPPMEPPQYSPEIHLIFYLLEREQQSVAQACRDVGKSRLWIYRRVEASRRGLVASWISEEFDRIRHGNPRCDLCSDPIAMGSIYEIREGSMRLMFCGVDCCTQWKEMEAG